MLNCKTKIKINGKYVEIFQEDCGDITNVAYFDNNNTLEKVIPWKNVPLMEKFEIRKSLKHY